MLTENITESTVLMVEQVARSQKASDLRAASGPMRTSHLLAKTVHLGVNFGKAASLG